MTTIQILPATRTSVQQLWSTARDGLRERRQAAIARRRLESQLASYTTTREVNDLLASIQGQDEASVDEIRSIVVDNLLANQRPLGIAS